MDTANDKTPLTERRLVRRGLIAGLAAFGAAAAMKVTGAGKAQATDGVALIIGDDAQTGQSETRLTVDHNGPGLQVVNGGDVYVDRVAILAASNTGISLEAISTAPNSGSRAIQASAGGGIGVHGISSTNLGVWGISSGSTAYGVYGNNTNNGDAILGISHNNGDFGTAIANGSGIGVHGKSGSGTGVRGVSNNSQLFDDGSGTGTGVHGKSGSGVGVRGESTSGAGVSGTSTAGLAVGIHGVNAGGTGIGVRGFSNASGDLNSAGNGSGIGVLGKSGSGPGVLGESSSAAGVFGKSNSQPGVHGESNSSLGVRGISTSFVGVVGISTGNHGLYGSTNAAGAYGIVAENLAANGPGLLITGAAPSQVFGGLQVFGVKNAVLKMQDGSFASVYCQESPEPYFEDFGRAQVVGGIANVPLEREFATLVAGGDYHVFLTARGPSGGLYVSNQGPAGFEVRDPQGGSVAFSYRIVTKRKDIEGRRFARVSTEAAEKVAGARAMLSSMGTPSAPTATPPGLAPVVPPANPTVPAPPVTNQQGPNPTLPNPTLPGATPPGPTGIGGVR